MKKQICNSEIKVVIRYFDFSDDWSICHAKSYQNAFRSSINSFATREDAAKFAKQNGCIVEYHEHDPLQKVSS